MAIAIKHIPIVRKEASRNFEKSISENIAKRESVDFTRKIAISKAILKKAKM